MPKFWKPDTSAIGQDVVKRVYSYMFPKKTSDWANDNLKSYFFFFFFDKIKITEKCTFADGWLQSNKKLSVGNLVSKGTVW